MNKFKEDVIFLDADATIESFPKLFFDLPKETDLAGFYFDWMLHWRNQTGGNNFHLLSGTLFIKYNPTMIHILNRWIKTCKDNPNMWEQKVLQGIVEQRPDLNIYKLPASYCAVATRTGEVPDYIGKAVIFHHQVSRIYKNRRP